MIINQWIPAAHRGDAVGDSARKTRDLLRRLGHRSEIYALTIDEDMRDEALPFSLDASRGGDVTIFHYALPSPMTSAFAGLPRGRVLQYHNVTPARFFADFSPGVFRIAAHARQDLASLVDHTDLALGVSDFNRRELEALGFRHTAVLPIALDLTRITEAAPHPVLEKILGDGLTNFLFVGRVVPNKRIEDILRLAEVYKRSTEALTTISGIVDSRACSAARVTFSPTTAPIEPPMNPKSITQSATGVPPIDAFYRFVFVGRAEGMPRYYAAVRALAARFKMLPERFLFVGAVTDWELAAYYRTASVYLSLSEHEGFAVPLLEAMAARVPVFAYDSSAISETLGGAGVCWSPKDLEFAAELLGQVAFDRDLREKVIGRQLARLDDFSEAHFVDRLQSVVQFAETHQ